MGCAPSGSKHGGPEGQQARDTSRDIDTQIKQDRQINRFRVLLLVCCLKFFGVDVQQGAGDSGKSTFLKQMTLLYNNQFSEMEAKKLSEAIRSTTIYNIRCLCKAVEEPKDLASDKAREYLSWVLAQTDDSVEKWGRVTIHLWKDPHLKDLAAHRLLKLIPLDPNYEYFLDAAPRVFSEGYQPTNEDLLGVRMKTTGVHECLFNLPKEGIELEFVDVGGQRSERRKWMNQFDSVHLVLYFSALDNYALQLSECTENRADDDLRLFTSLLVLVPKKIPWIVFFTKVDLFPKTLEQVSFHDKYPEVPKEKATDKQYCTEYIQSQFRSKWKEKNPINFFTVCGLDRFQIADVWNTIKKDLLGKLLRANF